MKEEFQSEMMQVLYEDMKDMHQAGIISDARMREFDDICLVQEPKAPYKPEIPSEIEPITA